jgi:hypothetical protein
VAATFAPLIAGDEGRQDVFNSSNLAPLGKACLKVKQALSTLNGRPWAGHPKSQSAELHVLMHSPDLESQCSQFGTFHPEGVCAALESDSHIEVSANYSRKAQSHHNPFK